MHLATRLIFALVCATTAACGKQAEEAPAAMTQPDAAMPTAQDEAPASAINASIASADRLEADRDEDAWRKPDAVLKFLEVRPGMKVVDYLAGGGYYTELLARIVGPQGEVIAFNNPPYLKYSEKRVAERYTGDRLTNVAQLTTPPEVAPFEPNSLDAALFVQSYHDLYWRTKEASWTETDPAKALAALVPALKSGAVVVVVDHIAPAGSDPLTGVDALHRIDPAIVKRDFEAAGLKFDAESPVFSNPADDHTKAVFDDSIRHKTDQFMYRFRKP